jgi:hypothetical protein
LQKNLLKKTYFFFLAGVAAFILSLILLTLPGSDLPSEEWFDKIWLDKWIHIGMFSGLTWLWCRYMHLLKSNDALYSFRRAFITIGLIFLGYGITMEFVQKYLIPLRSFDVMDILADSIGCALGAFFSIRMYIKKIDPCGNRGRNKTNCL